MSTDTSGFSEAKRKYVNSLRLIPSSQAKPRAKGNDTPAALGKATKSKPQSAAPALEWEWAGNHWRAKVQGGWLVKAKGGLSFVSDSP